MEVVVKRILIHPRYSFGQSTFAPVPKGVTLFSMKPTYENPPVTPILREIFRMSQEPIRDNEHIFSPDGTGLPTSMKQLGERLQKGLPSSWQKILMTMRAPTLSHWSADAAYLSRDNCNLVVEAGAVPRIYPKQGVTLSRIRRSGSKNIPARYPRVFSLPSRGTSPAFTETDKAAKKTGSLYQSM